MTETKIRSGPGVASRYARSSLRREIRRDLRDAAGDRAGDYPPVFEAGAAVFLGCLVGLAALLPFDCPRR